ncbi:MAG TPA: polysaccharide deacetylase family protein, partial [Bdellovibrionota bacterium]|nr:polysaccharide deacetylase family protein [Bdellovibrionota bacterium]
MVCGNHPDAPARRRCYSCKLPICPSCQQKAHHHIFCGPRCAQAFAENREPVELSTQLEQLDASLNEDLREYGDIVAVNVRNDFEKLETELDHALTALATMVEGSAVAAAGDLKSAAENLSTLIQRLDRAGDERTQGLADRDANLQQISLAIRNGVLELRDQITEIHGAYETRSSSLLHQVASLQGRIDNFFEKVQGISESQKSHFTDELKRRTGELAEALSTFGNRLDQQKDEVESGIEKIEKVLEGSSSNHLKDLHKLGLRIDEQAERQLGEIQNVHRAVEKTLSSVAEEFRRKLNQELVKVVDQTASLFVAHRGNWNDVVQAATTGAKELGAEARADLQRRLKGEIETLTREQSRALGLVISDVHRELKERASGKTRPGPWMYGAAAALIFVMGSVAWTSFRYGRSEGRQLATHERVLEKLEAQDQSLRKWVEEKLASLRPKTVETLIPSRAAVTRGDLGRREVAFTFDAGSNARVAGEILDDLKARNIHSTMFLTGQFIADYPDIVKRIAAEGHEAANHLLVHDHLINAKQRTSALTKEAFAAQLEEVERRYQAVAGTPMAHLWRAPYGEINDEIVAWARSIGYTHVGWTRSGKKSLDTLDWVADPKSSLYRSSEAIYRQILDFEQSGEGGLNGAVILMHLGSERTFDYPHKQ